MKSFFTLLFLVSFVFANAQCLICEKAAEKACLQNVSAIDATDATCIAAFGSGFVKVQYSATDCNLIADCAKSLPVELTLFELNRQSNSTVLNWQTASEINNDFFEIETSSDGEVFTKIGTVQGAGSSNETLSYEFVDRDYKNQDSYYRLKQVDFDGNYEYSDVLVASRETEDIAIVLENPASIDALSNYIDELRLLKPNAIIKIYDLQGRELELKNVRGVVVVCVFERENVTSKKIAIKN